MSEGRWEEPLARPLYITVRRAAAMLDVPYWKAYELSYCIETRRFGAEASAIRILLTSLEEYIELQGAGLDARALMSGRRQGAPSWQPSAPALFASQITRRRRRRTWR